MKIDESTEVIALVQSLEPFIQHHGAFRWAALLTLASCVEYLPNLQLLKLIDCDIVFMEKYLTHFSDGDQSSVLRKFQSILLLPDNRDVMCVKGLIEQLSSMYTTEVVSQRKEFLKALMDTYETSADFPKHDEAESVIKRLTVTIQQCRFALINGTLSVGLLQSAEFLLIQFRRKIIDAEITANQVPSVTILLLSFITEYLSEYIVLQTEVLSFMYMGNSQLSIAWDNKWQQS